MAVKRKWTRKKTKKAGLEEQKSRHEQFLSDVYYQYGSRGALLNNVKKLLEVARERAAKETKGPARAALLKKLNQEAIVDFLSKQPSYTVHRRVGQRQFKRRQIIVPAPRFRVDGDLLELRDLSPWNSGYNYALILIDAFTRHVWAKALKTKESEKVARAFEELRSESDGRLSPYFLYTDAGKEFIGAPFQSALRKAGIEHRVGSAEDFHCPFVERVIRTLKEKLFQAMTAQHTRKWVDLLPKVVDTYNQTDHSATGMTPRDATRPENYLQALSRTYPRDVPSTISEREAQRANKRYKFKVGDLVRILKQRGLEGMHKGYLPNFTWEIFRIKQRANDRSHDKTRQPAYILEDLKGEEIEHSLFYEPELVKVHPKQIEGPAPVREILKQKPPDQILVWFQGQPKSEAVWMSRKNLV